MWIDLRHAIRSLAESRSVVALSVLCLGLGIGVVTMVFAVLNGVLLQPLPFRDPSGLLQITETSTRDIETAEAISSRRLDDWRRQSLAAELAAVQPLTVTIVRGVGSERHQAMATTSNAPAVLGVGVLAGRAFRVDENRPGAGAVALISEAFWREELGADDTVVGSRLLVNDRETTVIGLVPSLAHPAVPGAWRNAAIWVPLASLERTPDDTRELTVIARVPEGEPPTRVAAALAAQLTAINAAAGDREWAVRAAPLDVSLSPTTHAMLATMTGAAILVLLIGCGNVASLLMIRSTGRRREMATRLALGASHGRILRQLLIESAAIGLASAPLGLFVGWLGRTWILGAGGDAAALAIDARVVGVAIGAGLLTSLLFGLAPAVQAMRTPAGEIFVDGGRQVTAGRSARRLRLAFATGEVVLSLVLLLGASLLARSFANLLDADRELDLSNLVAVGLGSPEERREAPAETARAIDEMQSRLVTMPGVASMAVSDFMPLRRTGPAVSVFRAEDGPATRARTIRQSGISAGFFETMGIALDAGRPFTAAEADAREPVAVVNRRLADLLWPGEDATGKRFRLGVNPDLHVVVGVAKNISNWDVSGRPLPTAYVPLAVQPPGRRMLILRATGDAAAAIQPVRDVVAAFDRLPRAAEPQLLETVSREAFFRQRTLAVLFGVFSLLSLLLTAVGLYGVQSYFVSHRRRELGIRAALGASRRDLAWLVVREGGAVVGAGAVIGLLAGLGAGRVLQSLLFGVRPTDPLSVSVAVGTLAMIALIASWAPAHRAALMEPAISLRDD